MFVNTDPAAMVATAGQLQELGITMTTANGAAAAPTTGVIPPATDPTSALLALSFATHGGVNQAAGAVSTVVNEMFVTTMVGGAGSYEATEGLNIIASM